MLNKSPLVLLLFPLLLAGCHHHQPTPRAAWADDGDNLPAVKGTITTPTAICSAW